jgi:hypothetical protein
MKHTKLSFARLLPMWLAALYLVGGAWGQAPTALTVKAATNTQVQLGWTGSAPQYTVQRAPVGGSFVDIATISTNIYTDTIIDPYVDYTYQVIAGTTGNAASNQVTTGPPPAGLSVAAPAPLFGNTPGNGYGYNITLAINGNGDPAIASG